jgi:hypothetical protein
MMEFIIGYMLGLTTLYYTPYIFNKSTIKQEIEDIVVNILNIYKKDIDIERNTFYNKINNHVLEFNNDINIISHNLEELHQEIQKSNPIKKKTGSL